MVSIAPIEPIDQPELPKPSPPRRRSPGMEVLFGLLVAAVVAVLGAPVGLLWSWIAPKVELVQTPYGPYPIEGEPEGYFADDGWFMIIGVVAGILVAVVAWIVLRRYRGALILAGLVIGSAAGAALAAWLGGKIGYAHYLDLVEHAPVETHIFRPAKVRAGEAGLLYGVIPWVQGSLLVQAIAAAVVYTGLAGFHASPTLTYDPDPLLPAYDGAYHPVYAGYPYGDPNQPPAAYPAPAGHSGAWPDGSQPAYGTPPGGVPDGTSSAAYGPPPTGGLSAYGASSGGGLPGPWPQSAPPAYGLTGGDQVAGGPPVNGQPHEHQAPGGPDLRKPGTPTPAASTAGASTAGASTAGASTAGASAVGGPAVDGPAVDGPAVDASSAGGPDLRKAGGPAAGEPVPAPGVQQDAPAGIAPPQPAASDPAHPAHEEWRAP